MKLVTIVAALVIVHRAEAFIASSPMHASARVACHAEIITTCAQDRPSDELVDTDAHSKTKTQSHIYGAGDPNHKPSILQVITAKRCQDVVDAKMVVSDQDLMTKIEAFDKEHGKPLNLFKRINEEKPNMALAAEFKRASPSKGNIAVSLNAGEQGSRYASVGAAVISVLTEPKWFKGSLEDMKEVRLATQGYRKGRAQQRPAILRKDFIVDGYQILEARAYGADTVLLIVAILDVLQLGQLIFVSRRFGMEPLVEVNTEQEMRIAIQAGAKVIGVNNRNLHTFDLDLDTTQRLAIVAAEKGVTWQGGSDGTDQRNHIALASLSGIRGPEDVERFQAIGASMVLIGETLMRAQDPTVVIQNLFGKSHASALRDGLIKICGVTRPDDAIVAAKFGANIIGIIFAENSPRRYLLTEIPMARLKVLFSHTWIGQHSMFDADSDRDV